jgi:glycosyltransferase involved in cell wall biosynthesis
MLVAATCGMSKPLRVLVLTKYGCLGASSRLRFLQYLPLLQKVGLQFEVHALLADEQLRARYLRGSYAFFPLLRAYASRLCILLQRHRFDVVWIEKEALPWFPLWWERMLLRGVPYVLDYDDAIFHNYDQHNSSWVRKVFGRRVQGLVASAALVVGGNQYLASYARSAGCGRVEILPTVIDLERYPYMHGGCPSQIFTDRPLRVAWIGSPSTLRYLTLLANPLRVLSQRYSIVLYVIGGGSLEMPGVTVEQLAWNEDTEVEYISACDIGVMPLLDSAWEMGKCGYKLIQYMACGLPTVASNVGANQDIVSEGIDGFLVASESEWILALDKLLRDGCLREDMGCAGRKKVQSRYCLQQTWPKLADLLRQTSERSLGGNSSQS